MEIVAPRGTNDILPPWSARPQWDSSRWNWLEQKIRRIFELHGYREIRTPLFESTDLFVRGIGEATDIVEKEMYTFLDKGGRSITLRPEGTASVVRAYLEHKMYGDVQPAKMYYIGPMFRYERPQAGRYRQFYQYGAEVIGTQNPVTDVEVMVMPIDLYKSLGLDVDLQINSIGCPVCRPRYRETLREHLKNVIADFCPSCRARYERNPMRILDCKEEKCRTLTSEAPSITDFLCDECGSHFEAVQLYLRDLGIPFTLNRRLVRGFDYYTKTVFEIVAKGLGAQDAVGGGGRYDGLVEECGGKPTPAVGFAAGMDRLILALEKVEDVFPLVRQADVYLASLGQEPYRACVRIAYELRRRGIGTEFDYLGRSLKAQMKAADKANARITVILGEDELARGTALVRKMANGTQQEVPIDELISFILASMKDEVCCCD